MAEVIKFPGGGKGPKKPDENKPAEQSADPKADILNWEAGDTSPGARTHEQVKSDSDWIRHPDNRAKAYQYREYGENVVIRFIDSLKGYVPTKNDLKLRRAGFKDKHVSELIDLMLNSTKDQWRQHPSFYQALRIEINERAMIAKKYPPEKKGDE